LEAIYLGAHFAVSLKRRVKLQGFTIPPYCGVGLPQGCIATPSSGLLPHFCTLACAGISSHRRSSFCGTFPRLTAAAR